MRVADGGFEGRQVDLNDLLVLGVRVGLVEHRLPLAAALEVGLGHVVHREDAILCARLDGHIADAQAVIHRQRSDARAGELHRFIQRTVHADPTDDVEDEVLAGHPRGQRSGQNEPDGSRHLEPCHASGHAGRHIGGADTGGESAQRTVGAGMAVCANDAVARCHDAFFGQQRVLNAHLAHIIEVEDVVLVGKLAALLGLGRALDVLVGHEVVENDGDVLFVEHAVKACLLELVDGHRCGDVVAQHDVELGVDELARLDLGEARVCGQNFLRLGHSHDGTLLFILQAACPLRHCFAMPLPSCGTQHPLRALKSTCVLLAAAPTALPCFRHWRQSELLLPKGEAFGSPFGGAGAKRLRGQGCSPEVQNVSQ